MTSMALYNTNVASSVHDSMTRNKTMWRQQKWRSKWSETRSRVFTHWSNLGTVQHKEELFICFFLSFLFISLSLGFSIASSYTYIQTYIIGQTYTQYITKNTSSAVSPILYITLFFSYTTLFIVYLSYSLFISLSLSLSAHSPAHVQTYKWAVYIRPLQHWHTNYFSTQLTLKHTVTITHTHTVTKINNCVIRVDIDWLIDWSLLSD